LATIVGLSNTDLAEAQLKFVKTTVAYREVDGHQVLADVYRPDDEKTRPVIVWIHGGALIMGHRGSVKAQVAQLAAERGYALVSIDYRLAPETKLPEIISDIEAAFQWIATDAAKQFHLDPSRIVVSGGSAGGYLTLVTGYRVQPKPKALVAFWGYGDLVGDWYSKPSPHPRHNPRKITREESLEQTDGTVVSDSRRRKGNGGLIYLHCRQNGTWAKTVSGFDPISEADKIVPFEPVRNVTKDYPPTLLIHGTKDTDVPFEQSIMMAEQLEQHNVTCILKPIKNGEHGLGGGDPEQVKNAYEAMKKFITEQI
jgi:acetyl esterase/lipase